MSYCGIGCGVGRGRYAKKEEKRKVYGPVNKGD